MNKSIANSQDNITAGTYTAQSYGETETTLVRFVRLYQGAFVAGVAVVLVGIMAILAWSLLRARKAQQEAQAASSAKTAFLSRISHDIRTPLMLCPFCVRPLMFVLSASASCGAFRGDLADVRAVRHYGSISCVAKGPP